MEIGQGGPGFLNRGKPRGSQHPRKVHGRPLSELVAEDRKIIVYLDTSALAKLYMEESSSRGVREVVQQAQTVVVRSHFEF